MWQAACFVQDTTDASSGESGQVLKPGPVGVKEHKYSDGELKAATAVAEKAQENWSQISKQS